MTIPVTPQSVLSSVWTALGGDEASLDAVVFEGETLGGLPSVYPVPHAAAALVAASALAVADVLAARTGADLRRVHVDGRHAVAAFRSERYLRMIGWSLPSWDPIAGDYEARNGFIRLHTNYTHHREACLRVLGVPFERAAVSAAVRTWDADALETAVVASGGCAAWMRTSAEWRSHPQGRAVAAEPLVGHEIETAAQAVEPLLPLRDGQAPLAGVRVLDLTRIIAGPVCTRVLAAYGADVVRVDPPGFQEVGALLPDTTGGKRCVALDLRAEEDRRSFEDLVVGAHVLVSGYRSNALARHGYSTAELRGKNPALLIASLDAYGWTGPWHARRGFDSLVQMSCGIAARGAEVAGVTAPRPLPAQALDHGTGYLLARRRDVSRARPEAHARRDRERPPLAGAHGSLADGFRRARRPRRPRLHARRRGALARTYRLGVGSARAGPMPRTD